MLLERKKWRWSLTPLSQKNLSWDISPSHAFWGLVTVLFLAAGFFAISVELGRREQYQISSNSTIRSGDEVQVLTVIDGDEISVIRQEDVFTVRLIGVKCFESKTHEPGIQSFAMSCERSLRFLLGHKNAVLEFDDFKKDSKGRLFAYLSVEDLDVGEKLISEGLAFVNSAYSFDREERYEEIENKTKSLGLGIWNDERAKSRVAGLKIRWAKSRKGKRR